MHNYPDNWSWSAYDDYHDPKLECGHRADDGCDCWCEHAFVPHSPASCSGDNCHMACCKECSEPLTKEELDDHDWEERKTCKVCLGEEE